MTVSTKPLVVPNTVDMSTPLLTKELCRSSAHGVVPAMVSNSSGFVRWLTLSKGRASWDATVKWTGIVGSVNVASQGIMGLNSQICAVTIRKRLLAALLSDCSVTVCVTQYDSDMWPCDHVTNERINEPFSLSSLNLYSMETRDRIFFHSVKLLALTRTIMKMIIGVATMM